MTLYVFLLPLMFFLIFSLVRLCYLCWLHHWPDRSGSYSQAHPDPTSPHVDHIRLWHRPKTGLCPDSTVCTTYEPEVLSLWFLLLMTSQMEKSDW